MPPEPMPGIPCSAMVFTLDEELHLPSCLDSLRWCDDVIVVDSFSADRTREIGEAAGAVALAAADVSTGRFVVIDCSVDALGAELARLGAAEVVASETSDHAEAATSLRPRGGFDSGGAEARLKALFGVATLDGFGSFSRAGLAAAGGLVAYLEHTAKGALPLLRPPQLARAAETMAIDAATRESLEGGLLRRAQRLVDVADIAVLDRDRERPQIANHLAQRVVADPQGPDHQHQRRRKNHRQFLALCVNLVRLHPPRHALAAAEVADQ